MQDLIRHSGFLALFAAAFLCGCGAPSGTGQDSGSSTGSITLSISEILAVDEIIVGGKVELGLGVDSLTGKLSPTLPFQTLVTDTGGKTGGFSVSLSPSVTTVFFQVSGGTLGENGPALSSQSRFTGVIELKTGASTSFPRVNINPFTTLVANVKSLSPGLEIPNIASQAVSQFFQSTAVGIIDINSEAFLGQTSSQVETSGNAPIFQLMNEMIRVASGSQSGASEGDRVAAFVLKTLQDVPAGKNLFEQGGTVFEGLSSVAVDLRSTPGLYGGFFSEALSVIKTSSTASFKPQTFTSQPIGSSQFTLLGQLWLDDSQAWINSVSSGTAWITSSNGAALILTALPSSIRFDLSQNTYHPQLNAKMQILVSRGVNDEIEALVDPTEIDARDGFTLAFPAGASITGKRVKPDGTQISLTLSNKSKDSFPSTTGFLNLPLGEFISKAEEAAGADFPSSQGQTIDVTVAFEGGVFFHTPDHPGLFTRIRFPSVEILPGE